VGQHISGRMVQVGIQVQEVYSLELDLNEAQQDAFRKDPVASLRAFLEQQGHTVNSVSLLVAGEPSVANAAEHRAFAKGDAERVPRGVPGQRALWLDLLLRLLKEDGTAPGERLDRLLAPVSTGAT
jgi:hypothetical protein